LIGSFSIGFYGLFGGFAYQNAKVYWYRNVYKEFMSGESMVKQLEKQLEFDFMKSRTSLAIKWFKEDIKEVGNIAISHSHLKAIGFVSAITFPTTYLISHYKEISEFLQNYF